MDLMEVFKHLTDQEREQYAALEETLSSKGWALIEKRATETVEALIQQAAFAGTWEQNRACIGQATAWDAVANMRTAVDNEFAAIAAERMEADESGDDLEYE